MLDKTDLGRNYGIVALRVVSMLMVIMLHVLGHGGILNATEIGTTKYEIVWYMETAAFCAVNCYALISGYVGVISKYRISNLVLLWLRAIFYTITITVIFKIFNPNAVGKGVFIFAFFPVLSNSYWYLTSYVILFLFIPLLNIALNRIDKRKLQVILISLIILVSGTTPFVNIIAGDIFVINEGYSAWWLILLYLLGGYIRKYGLLSKIKTISLFLLFLLSTVLTWLSKLVIQFVSVKIFGEIKYDDMFVQYTSLTVFLSAIFLFLVFERIRFNKFGIKLISNISPLAFSVYLMHEQLFIKNFFIMNQFAWVTDSSVFLMILIILGIVLAIYSICSLLDVVRHILFRLLRVKERLNQMELRIKAIIDND